MQNAEGHVDLRRGKYSRRILPFRSTTLLAGRKADKSPRDLHSASEAPFQLGQRAISR